MKILVIRNDKLGDFMLAYPCFELLKLNIPNAEIHALVTNYTQPMAQLNKFIDKLIIDPGNKSTFKDNLALINTLRKEKYDAVITLYSTTRIGLILWLAHIPYRLAPATKIAQIFYNNKLVQRRSRSEKPEYAYNMDLIYHYFKYLEFEDIKIPATPYLSFPENEIDSLRNKFIKKNNISKNHKLFFLHAGSGGSAVNLTPQQFSKLADNLRSKTGHTIILTAGPEERKIAEMVANNITKTPYVIFESNEGIVDFSKHIQFADLFISGSTGPLHIAGALDTPTVGFYPRRRSATSLRWQTLNSGDRRLAISPPENTHSDNMSTINIKHVAKQIQEYIK